MEVTSHELIFAVLFLDLDRFKLVNDSLGHHAGDQLLVAMSRRLERIRRAGDTVARLGGDEFAFLVEGVEDTASAGRVADRVQRELAQPFQIDGEEVFTRASIGISLGGPAEHRPEDLLRDADTAMYRAKAEGVAGHAMFDATMHDDAVAALQLENDLRRAVDRGELRVRYQPIVALQSARIVGFEALVRWHHRERGMVPPQDFIPLAEETGTIGGVGRFVLGEACRQMRSLQQLRPHTPGLSLAVNVSGRQILQPDLVDQIGQVLTRLGAATSRGTCSARRWTGTPPPGWWRGTCPSRRRGRSCPRECRARDPPQLKPHGVKRGSQGGGVFEVLRPALRCSLSMHRSITTVSPAARARSAAASSITPSCIQMAGMRRRMASSTCAPTSELLRK